MRFYRYHGRVEAARQLAPRVRERVGDLADAIVVSVPRGGVVVGVTLARELGLPHDIVVARKISEERRPEWAVGAVTETGLAIWDASRKRKERSAYLRRAVREQTAEASRRLRVFRGRRKPRDVRGRTVILADDGIARGWTLLAATKTLRSQGARRVIVAVPVASRAGARLLMTTADAVVAGYVPPQFRFVGAYYHRFAQVSDERTKALLRLVIFSRASKSRGAR
jgi:predicted phosphoribosyltransferase